MEISPGTANAEGLLYGISVFVDPRTANTDLAWTLDSLADQTLDNELFEIVCCVFDADDNSKGMVASLQNRRPNLQLQIIQNPVWDQVDAFDDALSVVKYRYFISISQGDSVSSPFLERILERCANDRIALTYGCERCRQPGERRMFDNRASQGIRRYAGRTVSPNRVPAASLHIAQEIPTVLLRQQWNTDYSRSGYDELLLTRLIVNEQLKVHVLPISSHAFFYTVAKSDLSTKGCLQLIMHRLELIHKLNEIGDGHGVYRQFITRMIKEQARLLGEYARVHPEWYKETRAELATLVSPKAIRAFNHQAAQTLVSCYVFTPYNSPSAVVAAKRLDIWSHPFDVITKKMDRKRFRDPTLSVIADDLGGLVARVHGPVTSDSWRDLAYYCSEGIAMMESLTIDRPQYSHLYSRAQLPYSHALAALIKVRQPTINWIAEFSDPLSVGIDGVESTAGLGIFPEREVIDDAMILAGFTVGGVHSMHEWLELIAYTLADQLVFTNEKQRSFMVSRIREFSVAERVMRRSTIMPHPGVPQNILKALRPSTLSGDGKIHLGYFGAYYESRGLNEIWSGLNRCPQYVRDKIMLHIYVPAWQLIAIRRDVAERAPTGCVCVAQFVNYLEFLSIAKAMDWLLVTDSRATQVLGINPYFPSKYADYVSLGIPIWGIVESGSTLSTSALDAMSIVGDVDQAEIILTRIASEPDVPE